MIDADHHRTYETDGVVCLRQAFDAGWLAVASDAIEQGRVNSGPMYIDYSAETKPGSYYGDFWTWPQVPAMRTFIFESPAARLVGEVMGVPSVMLVTDNWLIREAGAINKAPWHHDAPYFDLDGKWCVLWMALEQVGPGEGIVVLKGSHKWGRTFMPESFAGTGPKAEPRGPYERTPDFARALARHDPVEYALEPGDCLVFDAFTVHGAASDLPAKRGSRRLTMRFAEGGAVYRRRGPWTLEMTEYLEREHGLVEGGPYRCALLPLLWSRDDDAAGQGR